MSNKELYKATFSKLHASLEFNTEDMKMREKGGLRLGKRMVAVVCVLVLIFAMTCIANAATDGQLVSTVKLWLNGSQVDTDAYQQEDGTLKIDMQGGDSLKVEQGDNAEYEAGLEQGSASIVVDENGDAEVFINDLE